MDELRIGKLDCAHRQLETAIELFFQHGDEVSVHTLTCAAYNVIRDINNNLNGSPMLAKQRFVQMSGKPSLNDMNEPENFFKHADRDPDSELTFYPTYTECLLADACAKYAELIGTWPPLLAMFTLWFTCRAPEQFDIPKGWESFAEEAKALQEKNDRVGFRSRLMALLSKMQDKNC